MLLNKEQLENAIKGVYGINTDASKYLDKFINFYFNLPRQNKQDHRTQYKIGNFIKITMQKYSFTKNNDNDSFMKWLEYWSEYFNLSLRDLEKYAAFVG